MTEQRTMLDGVDLVVHDNASVVCGRRLGVDVPDVLEPWGTSRTSNVAGAAPGPPAS